MNMNTTPVVAERDGLEAAFESYNSALKEQENNREQIKLNQYIMNEFESGPDKHTLAVQNIKLALAVALRTAGINVTVGDVWYNASYFLYDCGWCSGWFLDDKGQQIQMDLEISRIRCHSSSWRSHETDKYQIIVGDYGNKTRFPQKKDGSFSYDRIAETLVNCINIRKAQAKVFVERQRASNMREGNRAVRKAVADELGISEYGSTYGLEGSSQQEGKVVVTVKLQRTLTKDEAIAWYKELRAANLIDEN